MPEITSEVIVIGGGAAGLAAAAELARKGFSVTLLEARERLGGRILTVRPRGWPRAVELGAEFIHEGNPPLWRRVRTHRLRTRRVTPQHWLFQPDGLVQIHDVARRIGAVNRQIDPRRIGVRSFAEFLRRHRREFSAEEIQLATGFIEGFEAAPLDQMSARSVAGATLNDRKQFVLPDGYDRLVAGMAAALPRERVGIRCGKVVTAVEWRRGRVVVRAGGTRHVASAAIVTLPLGVLQARRAQRGAVRFDPPLRAKAKVLAKMRMGHVVRFVVRFDARKWRALLPAMLAREKRGGFGFIHSRLAGVPVWWSLAGDTVITGWAGGPAALTLFARSNRHIVERGLASLSRLLGVSRAALRGAMRGWEMHNWSRDPFSRGAYSFVPAGADDAASRLAAPVGGTLFFAGEATASGEETGTVHGAIASGQRAARELCQSRFSLIK